MSLLEPWVISSLIYCVPVLLGYLLVAMTIRGVNPLGGINFKSKEEVFVFILGGIILALLIMILTFHGVLPQ